MKVSSRAPSVLRRAIKYRRPRRPAEANPKAATVSRTRDSADIGECFALSASPNAQWRRATRNAAGNDAPPLCRTRQSRCERRAPLRTAHRRAHHASDELIGCGTGCRQSAGRCRPERRGPIHGREDSAHEARSIAERVIKFLCFPAFGAWLSSWPVSVRRFLLQFQTSASMDAFGRPAPPASRPTPREGLAEVLPSPQFRKLPR